jgi:hypothetical protein
LVVVEPALLPDLGLLRAHDQSRPDPSSQPAVRAAGRVFGDPVEGAETAEVERLPRPTARRTSGTPREPRVDS